MCEPHIYIVLRLRHFFSFFRFTVIVESLLSLDRTLPFNLDFLVATNRRAIVATIEPASDAFGTADKYDLLIGWIDSNQVNIIGISASWHKWKLDILRFLKSSTHLNHLALHIFEITLCKRLQTRPPLS
jgi:hypothetical protein